MARRTSPAMTLVDVLAALAILTATVATLTPLASDARSRLERSRDHRDLHCLLSSLPPPHDPSGERREPGLSGDRRLRWHSRELRLANNGDTSSSRFLILQIIAGRPGQERVLAERAIPILQGTEAPPSDPGPTPPPARP